MAGAEDAAVLPGEDLAGATPESAYLALAPRVLGYLRARGVEDPEGVTNEVFLALLPRWAQVRGGEAGLRTLVFSIAHARAVDDSRRRSRRPAQRPYEPAGDPRVAASAETVALSRMGADGVTGLVERLGEDQRAVVMLRVVADLSLEQTADVLGKSVGAVKQLQRRGLLRLRELMDGEEER